jgi:hypothetical protein
MLILSNGESYDVPVAHLLFLMVAQFVGICVHVPN